MFGTRIAYNYAIQGTMDKEITQEVSAQNRRKTVLVVIITVAVLALAVWLLRTTLKSTIKRSEITTAVVKTGNIENTINATGEVLPEFEEIRSEEHTSELQSH